MTALNGACGGWDRVTAYPTTCNGMAVRTDWAPAGWVDATNVLARPRQYIATPSADRTADPVEETVALMLRRYEDALRRLSD